MANAEFISIEYLKKETVISGNVDVEELKPHVIVAQEMYIQDLLGSNLYNTLVAEIIADTVTAENIILLNKIAPALSYYTFYIAMPFLMIKVKNKGLLKSSDPNTGSNSIELREMTFLQEKVLNYAEFHGERLVRFLCNNSADYPTYLNSGTDPDMVARGTAYTDFGFYIDNTISTEEERKILRKYLG